jgi:hypothetical protein
MEGRTYTSRILRMQLLQSKTLLAAVAVLVVGVIAELLPSYSWISLSALCGGVYLLTLVFSLTVSTAMHESRHLLELDRLDYAADNLRVHRIGSVSFRIIDNDRMTLEESYRVARAPFSAPSQYAAEGFFTISLMAINAWAPYPLNVALLLLTTLSFVSLLASFCCYAVIVRGLTDGFCVALARTVTSKGDVDEIVAWNRSRESASD